MQDFSQNLDGNIEKIRPSIRSLVPELEFHMEIRGERHGIDVLNAEADVEFDFPESSKSTNLNEVRIPIATVEPITQHGTPFRVRCPLRHAELERIEEMREGGDIQAEVKATFRGYQSRNEDMRKGTLSLNYSIRASEWDDILDTFGYHDNREFLMNLGAEDTVVRDTLTSVQSKLRRAERTHNDGDYESAIRACRDAIESLRHIDEEVKDLIDPQKWEGFEGSMGQFEKGFVGTLCHSEDMTSAEPPLKRDSDFVLGLTKSYVRYIAQTVSEES